MLPRLIPAHAGKTPRRPSATSGPRAHPRSRGENTAIARTVTDTMGSSPLTRGKRGRSGTRRPRRRLIPAHAGKTGVRGFGKAGHGAHPRSRGENHPRLRAWPWPAGSSPLTRGKLADADCVRSLGRLIPAHAGKTPGHYGDKSPRWAHPRSRGENPRNGPSSASPAGSSPLTRGKRVGVTLDAWRRGLIPAHAGKTDGREGLRAVA